MDIYSIQRSESMAVIRLCDLGAGRLEGTVRGPYCRHGRTLVTTHPVAEDGTVTIVDPCYWSPRMPFHYQIDVRCRDDSDNRQKFTWGLRWLETHRVNLRLDGRRFVVRAVGGQVDTALLSQLHRSSTAIWMREIDEAICQEASAEGTLLVVELVNAPNAIAQLRRLETYPAVSVVIMPAAVTCEAGFATDIVLAVNAPRQHDNIPDWAQAVVCSDCDVAHVLQTAAAEKPVLVCRSRGDEAALGLRVECDRLQRDLASLGQFAGYMVTPA